MTNNLILLAGDKAGSGEGLGPLVNSLINGWIGPVFLLIVAAIAVPFLKEKEYRKLFSFLGIVAIVALLVYAGNHFFGENGGITNTAKGIGDKVKTVNIARPPIANFLD